MLRTNNSKNNQISLDHLLSEFPILGVIPREMSHKIPSHTLDHLRHSQICYEDNSVLVFNN